MTFEQIKKFDTICISSSNIFRSVLLTIFRVLTNLRVHQQKLGSIQSKLLDLLTPILTDNLSNTNLQGFHFRLKHIKSILYYIMGGILLVLGQTLPPPPPTHHLEKAQSLSLPMNQRVINKMSSHHVS